MPAKLWVLCVNAIDDPQAVRQQRGEWLPLPVRCMRGLSSFLCDQRADHDQRGTGQGRQTRDLSKE